MQPNTPHTNGRYSNDGVPDPDSVELPEGFHWLSPAEHVALRRLINRVIVMRPLPKGWTLEVLGFATYSNLPTVEFLLTIPATDHPGMITVSHFHVIGWRPRVEMDATELHRQADAAWQASVQIDDVRGIAEEKANLSQDVQSRRFVLQRMNQAEHILDHHCTSLMEDALDVRNWVNPIPPGAMIEGTWACGRLLSK